MLSQPGAGATRAPRAAAGTTPKPEALEITAGSPYPPRPRCPGGVPPAAGPLRDKRGPAVSHLSAPLQPPPYPRHRRAGFPPSPPRRTLRRPECCRGGRAGEKRFPGDDRGGLRKAAPLPRPPGAPGTPGPAPAAVGPSLGRVAAPGCSPGRRVPHSGGRRGGRTGTHRGGGRGRVGLRYPVGRDAVGAARGEKPGRGGGPRAGGQPGVGAVKPRVAPFPHVREVRNLPQAKPPDHGGTRARCRSAPCAGCPGRRREGRGEPRRGGERGGAKKGRGLNPPPPPSAVPSPTSAPSSQHRIIPVLPSSLCHHPCIPAPSPTAAWAGGYRKATGNY